MDVCEPVNTTTSEPRVWLADDQATGITYLMNKDILYKVCRYVIKGITKQTDICNEEFEKNETRLAIHKQIIWRSASWILTTWEERNINSSNVEASSKNELSESTNKNWWCMGEKKKWIQNENNKWPRNEQ